MHVLEFLTIVANWFSAWRYTVKTSAIALSLWLLTAPAGAQWLNFPTPGIQRTADGKPNLTAPVPRTADGKPDFSGLWRVDDSGTGNSMAGIKAQPWARDLANKHRDEFGKDSPALLCLPLGPQVAVTVRKVVQTPSLIVLLYDDLSYRQVFIDGRPLEQDPNPTWMGYSVGHWEGDTMVIESNGFNDRTWLGAGYPHTEALHVTERLRRTDFGHMELQRTYIDPKTLIEPLEVKIKLELDADTEMLEFVCNENEKDRQHIVGTVSDFQKNEVAVAREILARYAGTYVFGPNQRNALGPNSKISLENGRLMFESRGGKQPMSTLSETRFVTQFGYVEFATDASYLTATNPEGDFQAERQR
jgi:hypothetical protein